MNYLKHLVILTIAVIPVAIIISILLAIYYPIQPGLKFSAGECLSGQNTTQEVINQKWENSTLSVNTDIQIYCSDKILAGRYSLDRKTINLEYYIDNSDTSSLNCTCRKELKYAFSELPKGDYQIRLVRKKNLLLTLGSKLIKLLK